MKEKFYPKKTTPLSGVASSLYTDVYFVVKLYFVFRCITGEPYNKYNALLHYSARYLNKKRQISFINRLL